MEGKAFLKNGASEMTNSKYLETRAKPVLGKGLFCDWQDDAIDWQQSAAALLRGCWNTGQKKNGKQFAKAEAIDHHWPIWLDRVRPTEINQLWSEKIDQFLR
jgi:hypothetical protein